MSETLGTDGGNLSGQGGSVINSAGDTLIATDNDGGQSYAFGPSVSRAIETGVINGDFATPPPELSTNMDNAENGLPYFTTEVSHTDATAPYVQAVEDPTVSSGHVLRFTIPNGAAAGRYARIVRFVAVPASAARTTTNQPRAAWRNATGTDKTQAVVLVRAQYYKSDGTTTTGTSNQKANQFVNVAASPYAYEVWTNPNGNGAIPEDAAYLRVEVGVQTNVLTTSALTVDLTEVRVDTGGFQSLFTDQVYPDLYGHGVIYVFNGEMWIRPNETQVTNYNPSIMLSASAGNVTVAPKGTGKLIVSGDADVTSLMTAANIKSGRATVTVTANVVSSISITSVGLKTSAATADSGDVSIVAAQISTRPDVLRAATISNETFSGSNLTGFTIYIFRTSSTNTGVYWMAIGR